jgi:hypothetical protein
MTLHETCPRDERILHKMVPVDRLYRLGGGGT